MVTFYDGNSSIGTGNISGTTAALTTSALALGSHSITAQWAGNPNYGKSNSAAISQSVVIATPMLSLTSSGAQSAFGGSITFTAKISNGLAGSVIFYDNVTTEIGSAVISGTTATATLSIATLAVGTHSITAYWAGNTDYKPVTSSATAETVSKATPTITWVSPAPIMYGTALSATQLDATANVAGNFVFSPASGQVLNAGAQTLSVTFTPSNTTDYAVAKSTVTLTVNQITTTLSLSTSGTPSTYGQSTTFSALVNTGGTTPTGTVTFDDGGPSIGSGSVSTVSATNLALYSSNLASSEAWNADCDVASPTVTANAATAPDGTSTATLISFPATTGWCLWSQYLSVPSTLSSKTYTFSVWLRAANATNLTINLQDKGPADDTVLGSSSAVVGTQWQRYTVTANAPSGDSNTSLEYDIDADLAAANVYAWGGQLEQTSSAGPYVATGSTAASGSGGIATLPTSTLVAGAHTITAVYAGDVNDSKSSSPSLIQVVHPAMPAINWAPPSAILYGTALSATQLDATANVSGTYVYSPPLGTVLPVGLQDLWVTFTPASVLSQK
jgi:hypothetical protein